MKQKEILMLAIIIFLTIVAWMMADIYHIAKTENVKDYNPQSLEPISVNIDTSVFTKLETKN